MIFQRGERSRRIRPCLEAEITSHDVLGLPRRERNAESLGRVDEGVAGHIPEVLVLAPRCAKPRIRELAVPPKIAEFLGAARREGLEAFEDWARIEHRKGVEQDDFDTR